MNESNVIRLLKDDVEAVLMSYGATLIAFKHRGTDVVLGFDTKKDYEEHGNYYGATIGRYANRIANARFELNDQMFVLQPNNGVHALHGGRSGFDRKTWEAIHDEENNSVTFKYTSCNGEEGYPGTLNVAVTYSLMSQGRLQIEFKATTDVTTIVNLCNHSYFNLKGHGEGDVLNQIVTIEADGYTPIDAGLIPTGGIEPVQGTGLDFRVGKAIGDDLGKVGQWTNGGYDHNFVLRKKDASKVELAARVVEPESKRVLKVFTDAEGMQFYTGNFIDGTHQGKGGVTYYKHQGFCMETQHFPNAINCPSFPSPILRPGETYSHTVVYQLTTVDEEEQN